MQNLFIIHSYNADTKESFGPYLVEHARSLGLNVIFPSFPIRKEATYQKWVDIMDEYLLNRELNENSIIIAHSLGTQFIPRYLIERNVAINTYISCAGFLRSDGIRKDIKKIIEDFLPSSEQISKSVKQIKNRYAIYSDNDHMNPKEELEYYAERLNAEKILIPGIGHLGASSGIKELPEALEIIKSHIINEEEWRR